MREALTMLRRLSLIFFACCLANAASAGEGDKKPAKPEPGTSVEMPFLMAPMSQDGSLLGYSYIASKLICSSPAACNLVRQKLAFIQDAFVREVNLKPVALASDPKVVDKDLLNARLTAAAKRIVGADKVQNMTFMEIKFSPLHRSDSTAPAAPTEPAPATTSATGAGNSDGKGGEAAKTASSAGATSKPASGPAH
jgi:hypothetical protein